MTAIRLHVSDVSVVSSRCDNPALWRAWAQTSAPAPLAETTTSYAAIPAGVRRRLSPLGRCALSALASLKPQADEPTVWASSWGDISRTFKLTQTLSQHEDMSPADFALSVHNAVGAHAASWLTTHASTSAVVLPSLAHKLSNSSKKEFTIFFTLYSILPLFVPPLL